MDFWLGALSFCGLAWLEIYFLVLTLVELQKCILRTPVAWSALLVPAIGWGLMMPVFHSGLRRQKSERAWNHGNWGVLNCYLLLENCAEAFCLLGSPRDWVVISVELWYTIFYVQGKWRGWVLVTGQVVHLTKKALLHIFYCIDCLNEDANYNRYCHFNKFSHSICEFKMCDFKPIFLFCGSFYAECYCCYEQGSFCCAETMSYF